MASIYPLKGSPNGRTMARLGGLIGYAVEFLLMPLKAALKQPLALVLLAGTLALVGAMLAVREFDAVAHRAPWLLAWGLLAYAFTVAVFVRCAPDIRAPELQQVRAVRSSISRLRTSVQYERAAAAPFIAEALQHLDDHLLPALRQLLMSAQGLAEYLSRYDSTIAGPHGARHSPAGLPAPDPAVLERVQARYRQQRTAIDECVREVANAEAALVSLLAVSDDTELGTRARVWSNDLLRLHDSLLEALRGSDLPAPPAPPDPVPVPMPALPTNDAEEWDRFTEEALKVMNNHFALAKCGLLGLLPHTLTAIRDGWGASRLPGATPLEQAQALHEVLGQAIERLKPVDGSDKGEPALRYNVVRERYLEGKEVKQIFMRRSISESTFHRYRRDGIEAIARELKEQEHLLARGAGSNFASG